MNYLIDITFKIWNIYFINAALNKQYILKFSELCYNLILDWIIVMIQLNSIITYMLEKNISMNK